MNNTDAARRLQIAVARADLIICTALKWAAVILISTAVLLLCLAAAHYLARAGPGEIDYDVTSEGPENDWTPAFYEWEDEL